MSTPTFVSAPGVRDNFDAGSLSWVMGEIREALSKSKGALFEAISQDAELRATSLRHAKAWLHQADGALQIVDIDGVSIITETTEDLIERMESGQIALTTEAAQVIESAYQAVAEYLEELLSGAAHQSVRLFPYYRGLLELRGAERIHPADLFFPNLALRPSLPVTEGASTVVNYLKLRKRFELALLPFLRKSDVPPPPSSAVGMLAIIAEIEQAQSQPQSRNFWWVMRGFAEGVASGQIPSELYIKQLFARINLQMRRLSEGSPSIAERLLRDALFFIARIENPSPLAQQICSTYQLTGLVPQDYASRRYGQVDVGALAQAKERLAQAKNLWNRIAGGDASLAQPYEAEMQRLMEAGSQLGSTSLAKLLRELNGIARHAAHSRPGDRLGLEMATSLLFVENALNNITRLADTFSPRADALTARLLSIVAGEEPAESGEWLDDMSREAQQRQTLTVLAGEMQSSLRQVEKTLEEYFREPRERAALPSIGPILHQISGALAVLDQDDAVKAVLHTKAAVQAFVDAADDADPDVYGFQDVAQNIGALSFFIETLQLHPDAVQGRFTFDEEHGVFRANLIEKKLAPEHLAAHDSDVLTHPSHVNAQADFNAAMATISLELPAAAAAATVEEELLQHQQRSAELAVSLTEQPNNPALQGQLRTALQRVQRDAKLLDNPEAGERAKAAIEMMAQPDFTSSQDALAEIVSATATPQSHVEPIVVAPVPQTDEAIDAELLEIFLMEADEVLTAVRQTTPESRADPHSAYHLTTLRRAFHTLKGSGRMVGLNTFGAAAWSIEQALNVRLSEGQGGSANLYALLDKATELLSAWVLDLQTTGRSARTADALVAAAERVMQGEPFVFDEDVSAAPAQPSFAQAETTLAHVAQSDPITEHAADLQSAALENAKLGNEKDDFDASQQPVAHVEPAQDTVSHVVPVAESLAGSSHSAAIEPALQAEHGVAGQHELDVPADHHIEATAISPTSDQESEAAISDAMHPQQVSHHEPAHVGDAQHVSDDSAVHAAHLTEGASGAPDTSPSSIDHPSEQVDAMPLLHAEEDVMSDAELAAFGLPRGAPEITEPAHEAALKSAGPMSVAQADVIEFPGMSSHDFKHDDNVKRIGNLEISVPLHNIYLTETDELVRVLAQDIAEWRHEPERPVSIQAVHASHSLAGSSATVGFKVLQEVAHSLEKVLQFLARKAVPLRAADYDVLEKSVDILKSMLQEFALGEMPMHQPGQVNLLRALLDELDHRSVSVTPPAPITVVGAEADAAPLIHDAATLHSVENGTPNAPQVSAHDTVNHLALAPSLQSAEPPQTKDHGLDAEIAHALNSSAITLTVAAPAPISTTVDPVIQLAPTVQAADRATVFVEPVFASPTELSADPAMLIKDDLDADLLPVFLEEGRDMLPQMGEALRGWQSDLHSKPLPQSVLRLLHTIKGSARMAGAMTLGQYMHETETRIEQMLHGGAPSASALEELLSRHDHSLHLFEVLQNPAAAIAAQAVPVTASTLSGSDAAQADASVDAAIAEALVTLNPVMPLRSTGGIGASANNFEADRRARDRAAMPAAPAAPVALVRVRADMLDRLVNQAGEVSISRSKLETEVGTLRQSLGELTDNVSRLRDQLREIEMQAETQITSRMANSPDREFDPLEFDRFTRLQEITRMMAESVSDVASVQHNLARTVEGATADLITQGRLTRELQQDLMRVRMVQFASISERLYRVTRQTSKEVDKRVNLDIRGSAVEIDRSVLEKMAGPFEHLLRNAIVHGIETREQRRAAGKNETGELRVEIRQDGNEVVLQFSDDGQGLNLDRIRTKAQSTGLLTNDHEVSDAELTDLIFNPGFTTAQEVTELAGRGVGMDVVRSEATSLGGRVAIVSEPGKGAQFTIHLPLTLAVTQVVILRTGDKTYAVPSVLVEQVQQLKANPLASAYNDGAVMWQGQRVPLYYLPALLGDRDTVPVTQQYSPLIILKAGNDRVAIHVDQIQGNREVVVKNIGPQLARMIGIAGATVLGSGEIVLILNPVPLAQRAAIENARAPSLAAVPMAANMGAVAELDGATPQRPKAEAVQGLRTQHIIMVVDDSLTVRRVTQRLLTREGYQVVLAKDGVDALEQLQAITPDVMVVDIEMPRMDGFDLTRNVRDDDRTRHIPIIMITSRTAAKHRNYAMELGVNEYLGKPYQEDDLLKSISDFISKNATVT